MRLHYLDWGGDGPPLLLVHATGFHARLWDPYIDELRRHARVIAVDQRGHGDSSIPSTDFAWRRLADDMMAVIKDAEIEGCVAAGHSSGGAAVATCAARSPGSIRSLLLIDPVLPLRSPVNEGSDHNPLAHGARRRRARWANPNEFEEAMRGRGPFALWRPEFLHAYARHGLRQLPDGDWTLKCEPESEARVYEGVPSFDPWPELAQLKAPSVFLRATRADVRPPMHTEQTPTLIPGCIDVPVDATHFVPMEQPELVAAALLDIMKGHSDR